MSRIVIRFLRSEIMFLKRLRQVALGGMALEAKIACAWNLLSPAFPVPAAASRAPGKFTPLTAEQESTSPKGKSAASRQEES